MDPAIDKSCGKCDLEFEYIPTVHLDPGFAISCVINYGKFFFLILFAYPKLQDSFLGWTVFVGTSNGTLIKYHLKKRSHRGKVS